MIELTADLLREFVDYNLETGVFTWKPRADSYFASYRASRVWHARFAGKTAGHTSKFIGYVAISISGKHYWAHRLAWLYVTGIWPQGEIDHIDGNRANNEFSNLRDVSKSGNMQNLRRAVSTKQSGLPLGVYIAKRPRQLSKPYFSHIRRSSDGVSVHLGYFATVEEAATAYLMAKRSMHAGCTI